MLPHRVGAVWLFAILCVQGWLTAAQDNGRKGSFLVIGDWGFNGGFTHPHSLHSNALQKEIARLMLKEFKSLGDVKFIINVGDSFYATGVKDKKDKRWQKFWRDIYAPELRSVPWYSVYGNHDIYGDDGCACGKADGSQCAQVNGDINNKNFFYMPNVSWYKEHPEFDLEVIGLDFNDMAEDPCHSGSKTPAGSCHNTCMKNLKHRGDDAEKLLHQRYFSSRHRNLIVFSHYPTDYFHRHHQEVKRMLTWNGKHDTTYFSGHRHNTERSTGSKSIPDTLCPTKFGPLLALRRCQVIPLC